MLEWIVKSVTDAITLPEEKIPKNELIDKKVLSFDKDCNNTLFIY